LLLSQVLVPVALVRIQRIVLTETVPELGPFSFEFLNLVFELSALGFVVFELLFFGDFDFFQIEAEVVRDAVELSEDFVFGHDVFHVSGQFVVLLIQFVELVVSDHDLLADFLGVDEERGVLVLFGHFPEAGRELSDDGVLVAIFFIELLVHKLFGLKFIPEVFKFLGGIEIVFLEFGFHVPNILIDNVIDVFDLFSCDEEFSVILVALLKIEENLRR
jgi:hypothetical protein